MRGITAQDWVILLDLHAIRCILAVFGRDVTRRSGHSGSLVLCTFEDDLYTVSFFRHRLTFFGTAKIWIFIAVLLHISKKNHRNPSKIVKSEKRLNLRHDLSTVER